ncbi:Na(+)-translocating NADH-quinone reductase subunit B [Neochlamydia sp. AcF65]|uniref:Na(+)-transporting NADH-quinone reductase subunit B n=1 Tax=unclassified Neochlamydia TaxID=2643326 RepID=UPI00140B177A|nr:MULTISPECIES: Na(+)-transporting NADH-quinone reductase subunit B [unclassified Neochlamydia]MBS4167314.1 Na(+)-translocating NADH-quinone reductase subunit B [Neochlamydia sp. AcF65]
MLRRLLSSLQKLAEPGRPLHKLHPLINANDTFLYEAAVNTRRAPHIRDAIDVKRWMILVVIALLPCIMMAIWNTGLLKYVYSSGDYKLMNEYLEASKNFHAYWAFATYNSRYIPIIMEGLKIFLPLTLLSYAVGGFWEAFFACVRKHEISEGFLVTGILYVLILPPTIPYWMAAVGVSAGVVLGKEIFGGSGMNIVNPALACRAFLFFTFPGKMSGDVWVGSNPTIIRESLLKMNQEGQATAFDGYSQATKLAIFNVPQDIKRIHVDTIATHAIGTDVSTIQTIRTHFDQWNSLTHQNATLGELTMDQIKSFVTSPLAEGGLGLSSGYYEDAYHFSSLNYGLGNNHDWSFFLGNKLGCLGETSTLACLLGALFLIWTGIGSWRTMLGMLLGALGTALLFQLSSSYLFPSQGAWTAAQFGFPAYKHLLLGGLAFGLVFMATDPVSSPSIPLAKWIYGVFCGMVTLVIRVINPAYPEGVMLAILMGNVFAPLFDYYAAKHFRKRSISRVRIHS